MSEIYTEIEPYTLDTHGSSFKEETLWNLSQIYEELEKWNVSEDKMEHIIDYVLKISQIESKYEWQKEALRLQIREFLRSSLKDTLSSHLWEYDISKFDVDWHDWLDETEQDNYSKALWEAITKIVVLWWLDKFSDIHKDSNSIDWFWNIDKYVASKVDLFDYIWWKENWKWFVTTLIQREWNITESELKVMQDSNFDPLSTNSWSDLWVLLLKELWDWVEDILRFLANIPAWAILIPRYLKYRADINSSDELTRTEWEIKIQELVKENPSLAILDLLWEKWVEMIKELWNMITSWKTWDIATMLVMIAWLLAWWAWIARFWFKMARKWATISAREAWLWARLAWETTSRAFRQWLRTWEKWASNFWRTASRVDDIIWWAWIWHMTWAFAANDNLPTPVNDNLTTASLDSQAHVEDLADWTTWMAIDRHISTPTSWIGFEDNIVNFTTRKIEKFQEISYEVSLWKLVLHEIDISWISHTQLNEQLLKLIDELDSKWISIEKIDFSWKMSPEMKKALNEIISSNYPALSIARLIPGQRVVDLSFSWIKWLNDNLSKEIVDLFVWRLKDRLTANFSSASISEHSRTVRSDYKHLTFSLEKWADFVDILFRWFSNKKELFASIFDSLDIDQIISSLPTERLEKLIWKSSDLSVADKQKLASKLKEELLANFDIWIWTSIVPEWAWWFSEKLRAFYEAESSSKKPDASWRFEATEFSFERVKEFAKKALEIEADIIAKFEWKKVEISWVKYNVVIENLKWEKIINPILLRNVRKWVELPDKELNSLIKSFIWNLNDWFDFISPIVDWVSANIDDINRAIFDWVIDVKYLRENNKWTLTRTALESFAEWKPWTRAFVDIVDMWIMNLFDFRALAKKVASWEITEKQMLELTKAWWSVTDTFQQFVKELKAEWIELSLWWDEVFMFSEKLTRAEMSKIIAENLEKLWLRWRVTFSSEVNDTRRIFDWLDAQTWIIKKLEKKFEEVIISHQLPNRTPTSIMLEINWSWKVSEEMMWLVKEKHLLEVLEYGVSYIWDSIRLVKAENNQIILIVN